MILDMKVTPVYEKISASRLRITALEGGTRSSKTYSLAQFILTTAITQQNIVFSVVRKSFPALKQTALKDVIEVLSTHGLYSEKKHNKTDQIIKIGTNEIEFFSVDDAQKVRGRKRDYLWCNEANELSFEDWTQLILRTTKRVFIDFNPSMLEHWIYDNVLTRDDCELIHSTFLDNPFLTDETIKEILRLKTIDPTYWKVYGLGKRADLKSGNIFPKDFYSEYEYLPDDVKSVIYCDPNLSIKGKGDTTSIIELGYSAKEDKFFVLSAFCESFGDSNKLLNKVLETYFNSGSCVGVAFDGNVSQESSWTNHIKNWCKIHERPFPRVEFRRYIVDNLAKAASYDWIERRILFPAGFKDLSQNKVFISQTFIFEGKKAGNPDDAPDSLICARQYLTDRKLDIKASGSSFVQPNIKQKYNF